MHILRLFDALLSMQESFESQKQLWKGIYLPRRHLPTTTAYPSQASSACDLVKEKKHHPLPCSVAFFVCGARFYTIIVSFINWPWQNELLGNKIKSFQLNHCKKTSFKMLLYKESHCHTLRYFRLVIGILTMVAIMTSGKMLFSVKPCFHHAVYLTNKI